MQSELPDFMRELDNIYRRLLTIGLIHTRNLLRDGRVKEARIQTMLGRSDGAA
jgi:hypothetical protein